MNTQLNTRALALAGALAVAVLNVVCLAIYAVAGRPDPWMDLFIGSGPTVGGWLVFIVEGAAVGALLAWLTPFTILQAAGIAILVTLMGFFGGLVMSAIKRDRGVKDWGTLIEGHGGVLDRLDSLYYVIPVSAVLLAAFVAI